MFSTGRNVLLAAACWFVLPVFAGGTNEAWLAQAWQTEEGLPDNVVDGVAQTSDGYFWVGTPSGLARFDGLQFETISLTNIIPLPNRGVISMLRGRHGALWLAMDRGAVVRLAASSSRSWIKDLPNYIPNGMAEDAAGSLWIAYRGGTVYRVKDGGTTRITEEQGLPAGPDICALATDVRGRIWFAKAGEVGVVSNGQFRVVKNFEAQPMRLAASRDGGVWVCCGFHVFKCAENGERQDFGEFHPETSGTVATVMIEDRDGNLWIGTSFSGIYRCNASGFQTIHTRPDGILCLTEDHEGNLWAGTSGGGLDRIRRRAITLEDADTGLPFPSIQSICEAADNTIWAVTQNGVLVHKTGNRWNSIPISDDWPRGVAGQTTAQRGGLVTPRGWPGDATCVNADVRGTVWIGTRQHGIFCWRDGKFVDWPGAAATRGQTFHTLLVATNGDLWIGQESPNAILRLHDGQLTTVPISPDIRIIRAMAQDAAGNIWAGSSHGNLLRVSGEQVADVTPRVGQELASIRCLYATPDGSLWIGYAGWGVGRLLNGHYTEFNSTRGLFDDYISHIVADNEGWLWFGANRGIFKVREKDFGEVAAGQSPRLRSLHYGRDSGLPSLQGTFGDSPDVLRSRDGRLWIPMQTALFVADPAKLPRSAQPPPVLLTRVLEDEEVVADYEDLISNPENTQANILELAKKDPVLRLPPNHHSLKFEFAAFHFGAPENIQFRHQLVGVDDDWVESDWGKSGAARVATYARLANGDYEFRVTACAADGNWNPNFASIRLIVAPFFWQTWWFRFAAVAAFTLGIIAVVRYVSFRRLHARLRVLEQQAALQRERARIAKDIHDDLGANLTQIAFLGELANQDRGEPALVGERIGKISATARQAVKSLDEIVWAVNPRNDTLTHLLDYAGQFAVDYLRTMGIRCRLDFPTDVPARELSTDLRHNLFLVIKEALHNIFKHANATEVWLRATADAQALEIRIEDNGRGFAQAPNDALADGLRNMQQRMADIGGDFRVESAPGKGTKIFLRLPWAKKVDS